MYTTSTEVRPLTIVEYIFILIVMAAALCGIVFGCYFTYMTRFGKHRMFEERVSETTKEQETERRTEGRGHGYTSCSSTLLTLEDTPLSSIVTSETMLINSDTLLLTGKDPTETTSVRARTHSTKGSQSSHAS